MPPKKGKGGGKQDKGKGASKGKSFFIAGVTTELDPALKLLEMQCCCLISQITRCLSFYLRRSRFDSSGGGGGEDEGASLGKAKKGGTAVKVCQPLQ